MCKVRRFVVAFSVAVLVAGCHRPTQQPAPETGTDVVLPAPSTSPRYAIAIDDPDEIALLQQQLKLGGVNATRGVMYFDADGAQLGRLRELGYEVTQVDPEAVGYRVVRVLRRGSEEDLRTRGLTVIAREKPYWIVSGSLSQLRQLVADGYRLRAIASNEPRPRLIRILVSSSDDVQRIANYQVDIFAVRDTTGRRFAVEGAALDMVIDRLRAAGFTVVVLP
jgi:hypothetical protein